jgi:quercetin dioxygenase-like cupin family protein
MRCARKKPGSVNGKVALVTGAASGAHVTFEPGARSAWHTQPAGQTLVVTSGVSWVQQCNADKREIRPCDVIWTPPAVKHWHGGTATNGMSHIAIQEQVDGEAVDWMEQSATSSTADSRKFGQRGSDS